MLMTYKAVLRGNQLEWRGAAPQPLAGQKQVDVYVTILDEQVLDTADKATQGQKMAVALEELATLPVRSVSDPLEWERVQRQERELPQR